MIQSFKNWCDEDVTARRRKNENQTEYIADKKQTLAGRQLQPSGSASLSPPSSTTTMLGLTVETGSSPHSQQSQGISPSSHPVSGSSSPTRPSYSPITPTLAATQIPASETPRAHTSSSTVSPQKRYAHPSQQTQTFIPHPQPAIETVTLDENPDAMALRSAITILQMQRKNAIEDMKVLSSLKRRALDDPEGFVDALQKREVRSRPDPGFGMPANLDSEDEDEDEVQEEAEWNEKREEMDGVEENTAMKKRPWPEIPSAQNVVKTPPINWAQYGIVGESLDKIHADQVKHPVQGTPAKIDAAGNIIIEEIAQPKYIYPAPTVGGHLAGTAPMEKMGTRKGGKR